MSIVVRYFRTISSSSFHPCLTPNLNKPDADGMTTPTVMSSIDRTIPSRTSVSRFSAYDFLGFLFFLPTSWKGIAGKEKKR